jgi:SAM-dependent methyltransferase
MPSPYDDAFFLAGGQIAYRSARVVVPLLMDLIHPRSVVDVGCGAGAWLSVFHQHGVDDYLGVDSSWVEPSSLLIPQDHFYTHNLDQELSLPRQFDLVLSLEVAEHLPAHVAAAFVRSLTRLGAIVVFSAAIPEQGGVCHINEQWPEYWAALFAGCGYVPADYLRARIWSHSEVEWWYAQNTFVYARPQTLARLGLHCADATSRLSLVHPEMYLKIVGKYHAASARADLQRVPLRKLLRVLPGAFARSFRRLVSGRPTHARSV